MEAARRKMQEENDLKAALHAEKMKEVGHCLQPLNEFGSNTFTVKSQLSEMITGWAIPENNKSQLKQKVQFVI